MPRRCASGAKISSVSFAFSCCFCLGIALDRAHVVQPVGELDQHDADVRGHRDDHLAVVLRLAVVAALEGDPGELGDAVDQVGDLDAELVAHLGQRRARVLDGVVQQRGAQRRGVEPHARADLRDADRVDDEVLARLAALVGVALAGEHERALDARAVDRLGGLALVLLDHRQQVAQQVALEVVQLEAARRVDGTRRVGVVDAAAVEARGRRRDRGGARPAAVCAVGRAGLAPPFAGVARLGAVPRARRCRRPFARLRLRRLPPLRRLALALLGRCRVLRARVVRVAASGGPVLLARAFRQLRHDPESSPRSGRPNAGARAPNFRPSAAAPTGERG